MKKNKVITLVTIIAVIAIAAIFFGVNHLMDSYINRQRATQSGNQAAAVQQPVSQTHSLIMATMDLPEENGVCGEHLEWYYKDEVLKLYLRSKFAGYGKE